MSSRLYIVDDKYIDRMVELKRQYYKTEAELKRWQDKSPKTEKAKRNRYKRINELIDQRASVRRELINMGGHV